jgi:hypothetical protein
MLVLSHRKVMHHQILDRVISANETEKLLMVLWKCRTKGGADCRFRN